MTVEQINQIDVVSFSKQTGHASLTISDHLDWEDETAHLILLQDKINTYLRYLESGEFDEAYPDAKGKQITIHVVFEHPPTPAGLYFLEQVVKIVSEAGFDFRHRVLDVR